MDECDRLRSIDVVEDRGQRDWGDIVLDSAGLSMLS